MDIAAVREAQARAARDIANLPPEQLSGYERLAISLSKLDPEQAEAGFEAMTDQQAEELRHDFDFWARPDQRMPEGEWSIAVLLSGRGSGKSWTGAQWARRAALGTGMPWEGKPSVGAFLGPTPADVRRDMIESPHSGILAVCPPHERPLYEPSKLKLTFRNGTEVHILTGAEPEAIRGPNLHWAWVDELAKFAYPERAWANLRFALRGGSQPQSWVTTTPRAIALIKELIALKWPGTVVRRVSTYRNLANLPESFVGELLAVYEGTRLGRQELHGEILEDVEGALLTAEQIVHAGPNETPTQFDRIVVGVDPSTAGMPAAVPGMGHEAGIVVAGRSGGKAWVLDDRSLHGPPERWAVEMILTALEWEADAIVFEAGFGKEQWKPIQRMAADLVQQASVIARAREADEDPPCPEALEWIVARCEALGERTKTAVAIREVRARRGKALRAEPVVGLHPGRIMYAGHFPLLEQQLVSWVPPENDPDGSGSGYSPDRLDAWAWALVDLMFGTGQASSSQSSRRQIATGAAAASRSGRSGFR